MRLFVIQPTIGTFKKFMDHPTLHTERLKLRQLKVSDHAAIFKNFSHPAVVKYYDLALFTDESQAKTLIDNWLKRAEKNEGMRWAICLTDTDELIGTRHYSRKIPQRPGEKHHQKTEYPKKNRDTNPGFTPILISHPVQARDERLVDAESIRRPVFGIERMG